MTLKRGMIMANGLNFAYLEAGDGPLILALHGFPDHARSFRHQASAFAAAGYHLVAPFLRGYKPTDTAPDGIYHVSALVQDAIALLEQFSDEPAILIGHDWGAAVAYGVAAAAPERVSQLVTMAVPHGGLNKAFVRNRTQLKRSWYMFFFQNPLAEAAVSHNNFDFLEQTWRDWSPNWDYPAEEMILLKETFQKPGVLTAALAYYRHMFSPPPLPDDLKAIQRHMRESISVPTLYIHGEQDACIGVEVSQGMEKRFSGEFHQVVVSHAGHFVHQERPKMVNQLILEFLA